MFGQRRRVCRLTPSTFRAATALEEGPRQTETPNFLRHKLLSYRANHQLLMSAILRLDAAAQISKSWQLRAPLSFGFWPPPSPARVCLSARSAPLYKYKTASSS